MIDINTLRFEVRLNKMDNSQLVLSPLVVDDLLDRIESAEKERDALRARIEAMEQQVPICRAEDLRHAEILLPSLGLMPEDKLYALPVAKGEEK